MSTPTELYLVRHAIAAERGSEWPDDTKRPLTERGISRFKEAVKGLRHLDVWQSRQQWLTFRDAQVRPAVAAVLTELGIPAPPEPPEEHELDLVDVAP